MPSVSCRNKITPETDFLGDDIAREIVEQIAAKRTGKGINKLFHSIVNDYIEFERRRIAGSNVIPPDSEEQIDEWLSLLPRLSSNELDGLRHERIDYGYGWGSRLAIAIRLWLSCFHPQDEFIPVAIRKNAIGWDGCSPSAKQLAAIHESLVALRSNVERWPAQ